MLRDNFRGGEKPDLFGVGTVQHNQVLYRFPIRLGCPFWGTTFFSPSRDSLIGLQSALVLGLRGEPPGHWSSAKRFQSKKTRVET